MWRASMNLLPTPANLCTHHVPTSEWCKILHSGNSQNRIINVDWACHLLESFHKANLTYVQLRENVTNEEDVKWFSPECNQVRLDVDAGFNVSKNKYSVAAVIRNHMGQVLGAKVCLTRKMESVIGAELFAIRFGMEFALSCGHDNICIFSDALAAVNAVLHLDEDLNPTGVVISDIRRLLNIQSFIYLRHMRRSANSAANFLAKHAILMGLNYEWTDGVIPLWFYSIVDRDIIIIN